MLLRVLSVRHVDVFSKFTAVVRKSIQAEDALPRFGKHAMPPSHIPRNSRNVVLRYVYFIKQTSLGEPIQIAAGIQTGQNRCLNTADE